MAKAVLDPKSDNTKKAIARAEFRDLGVTDKHLDSFMDWIAQHDEHPTLDELQTDPGQLYMSAIARYVDPDHSEPAPRRQAAHGGVERRPVVYALTT